MGDNKISEAVDGFIGDVASKLDDAGLCRADYEVFRNHVRDAVVSALHHLQGEAVPVGHVVHGDGCSRVRWAKDNGIFAIPDGGALYAHPQPAELSEVSGGSGEVGRAARYTIQTSVGPMACSVGVASEWEKSEEYIRELEAALAATGKQQVGEVKGDARSMLAKALHAVGLEAAAYEVESNAHRGDEFEAYDMAAISAIEAALASRQSVGQEPAVCVDESLLDELDEAAEHGSTLSVTYLRELAKRSAAALRSADPVVSAHAANLQSGLDAAERISERLRQQLVDTAPPAQQGGVE